MSSPGASSPSTPSRRKYNKKHPVHQPGIQPPTSPPQLAEYAFNIHGWALEDGLASNRDIYEEINAYSATMIKGGFKAKIAELEHNHQQPYRSDLSFTARELNPTLSENDPAVERYLVVGYTLQEHDPIWLNNRNFIRNSDNELVGESPPPVGCVIGWNEVFTPILVVTPIKENTGTSIRLFGLIAPRSGLCQPVLLQHERVFYRWEFRASAGAKSTQRNKIWNQVAIDRARMLTPDHKLIKNEPSTPSRTPRAKKRKRNDTPDSSTYVKQEDDDENTVSDASTAVDSDVFEMVLELGVLFETKAERRDPVCLIDSETMAKSQITILMDCQTKAIISSIQQSRQSLVSRQIEPIVRKLELHRKACSQPQMLTFIAQPDFPIQVQDAVQITHVLAESWPEIATLNDMGSILKLQNFMFQNKYSLPSNECVKDFLSKALPPLRACPKVTAIQLFDIISTAYQYAKAMREQNLESAEAVAAMHMAQNLTSDNTLIILLLRELAVCYDYQQRIEGLPDTPAGLIPSYTYVLRPNIITNRTSDDVLLNLQDIVGFCDLRRGELLVDVTLWLERLRLRIRQV